MVLDDPYYVSPMAYDVVVPDIGHDDLKNRVAERLGVSYLAEPASLPESQKIVSGVLLGANARPMVNLVVSSKAHKKAINVIFLVDSTSPDTYLSTQAMEALGFPKDKVPSLCLLQFNGVFFEAWARAKAVASDDGQAQAQEKRFGDINIIGSNFLRAAGAKVLVDYHQLQLTLQFRSILHSVNAE